MARPAADGGEIEILLVERGAQLRFMGGMHVFPGGGVHSSDADARIAKRVSQEARAWSPAAVSGRTNPPAADSTSAGAASVLGGTDARAIYGTGAGPEDRARAVSVHGRLDLATIEALDPIARDRAYAVAAIRETCEEVGLLLGTGAIAPAQLNLARQLLNHDAGEGSEAATLVRALDTLDASLDLSVLVPLSRWITPFGSPVRFDTRFYVAAAPSSQDASADGTEIHSLVWYSPARALEAHRDRRLVLSPPTHATLRELVGLSAVNQLLEYAASRPAPCFGPLLGDSNET